MIYGKLINKEESTKVAEEVLPSANQLLWKQFSYACT